MVALLLALLSVASANAANVSYQRDVWPILKRHCLGCHTEGKAKGGLRLDDVAALKKGGKHGALFVTGKPDKSLLIQQVTGDPPEMPENEPPLTAEKVKVLRDWIAQGAKIDAVPKIERPPVVIPAAYTFAPAVTSVSLSPDGKQAAVAVRSEVVLFNVDDDTTPRRLATDFDLITHVEFSPDGKRLAAAGGSPQQFGAVIFFDPADGKRQSTRRVGNDTLFKGNFSPDGQTIALGGAGGAIHLIPVDAKAEVKAIDLHSDWVMAVAYTPDGKQLVSGSRDKTTKVSSVEGLRLLRSIDQSADIINAVAADTLTAISAGNARTVNGFDFKLALAGAEVTGSGNSARPVNNRDQYVRAFEAQADAVMALAMSGDRKLLAVATRAAEVRVYQTDNRQRKTAIAKAPAPVLAVALNQDGSRLLIGSKSGEVQVYEVATAKLLKTVNPVPMANGWKFVASLVNRIKSHATYTSADGNALKIEGAEQTGPDPETTKPTIKVVLGSGGRKEVQWKKLDFTAIKIEVDRGNGVFVFLAMDSVPHYIDTLALAPGTAAVWRYRAIYLMGDEVFGQWSDVVSIAVTG